MARTRISNKLYGELPPAAADTLRSIVAQYPMLKSAAIELKPAGWRLGLIEGSKYWAVVPVDGQYIASDNLTMVSAETIGATGVSYRIGDMVPVPTGAIIFEVWYFAGFGLTIYNVGEPALPAPKTEA